RSTPSSSRRGTGSAFSELSPMPSNHLATIIYLAFLIWAAILAIGGTAVPEHWRDPLLKVVAAVGWIYLAFDRWLWKVPVLYPWFVKQPNLHGTFRATLESTWENPSTGSTPDPIEAYFVVRQRYSGVSVRMFTKESNSASLAGSFGHESDGAWTLIATYQNTPGPLVLHRSAPHFGSLLFTSHRRKPFTLEGQYWTSRNTRGAIHITGRSSTLFDSFDAART